MRLPRTQQLSDGEIFYFIENGIRLTGMPGWSTGTPEGERSSWQLVHFIRRLPKLTAEDLAAMEAFNPVSRQQIEEEKKVERLPQRRRATTTSDRSSRRPQKAIRARATESTEGSDLLSGLLAYRFLVRRFRGRCEFPQHSLCRALESLGAAAVAAFWEKWFVSNPDARFEAEEVIVSGDRCIVRWIYRKMRDGKPWHLRGIDVFTIRDGKVAAKYACVKG